MSAPYFVSRQLQWPDGERLVEIAEGGRDYSGPDMLSTKYPGEGREYDDPREAVRVGLEILAAWRADQPETEGDPIAIGYGNTLGMGLPITASEEEQVRAWAEEEYQSLRKCAECGDILTGSKRDWAQIMQPPDNVFAYNDDVDEEAKLYFCSERCGDRCWWKEYEYWQQQEFEGWASRLADPAAEAVVLLDTRSGYNLGEARIDDLDDEPEVRYRAGAISNEQVELDLAVLLHAESSIGWSHASTLVDLARERFPLVEQPPALVGA